MVRECVSTAVDLAVPIEVLVHDVPGLPVATPCGLVGLEVLVHLVVGLSDASGRISPELTHTTTRVPGRECPRGVVVLRDGLDVIREDEA